LDNFRLVKLGTTHDQKKLFYNLMREKDKLMAQGLAPDTKLIAQNLHVSEKAVIEMDQRLGPMGGEVSLDKSQFNEAGADFYDILADENQKPMDETLAHEESLDILKTHLTSFVKDLAPRDREIFEQRLMAEVPASLQSIADQYGVSRERIRQVESRLLDKLKVYMGQYLR
jgi:RNA polymerase sigma-32 factor